MTAIGKKRELIRYEEIGGWEGGQDKTDGDSVYFPNALSNVLRSEI